MTKRFSRKEKLVFYENAKNRCVHHDRERIVGVDGSITFNLIRCEERDLRKLKLYDVGPKIQGNTNVLYLLCSKHYQDHHKKK